MSVAASDLATALGSRLCHDLTSPLGAIQNGLELMTLSAGAQSGPEQELVQQSAQAAVARIRFFRLAFGMAGDAGVVSQAELKRAIASPGGPPRLDVQQLPTGPFTRAQAQRICLALLCLATAAPRGGPVRLDQRAERFAMGLSTAQTPDVVEINRLFSGATDDKIVPAKVHFLILSALSDSSQMPGFEVVPNETVTLTF